MGGYVVIIGCVMEPYGLVRDANIYGSFGVKDETGGGLI